MVRLPVHQCKCGGLGSPWGARAVVAMRRCSRRMRVVLPRPMAASDDVSSRGSSQIRRTCRSHQISAPGSPALLHSSCLASVFAALSQWEAQKRDVFLPLDNPWATLLPLIRRVWSLFVDSASMLVIRPGKRPWRTKTCALCVFYRMIPCWDFIGCRCDGYRRVFGILLKNKSCSTK